MGNGKPVEVPIAELAMHLTLIEESAKAARVMLVASVESAMRARRGPRLVMPTDGGRLGGVLRANGHPGSVGPVQAQVQQSPAAMAEAQASQQRHRGAEALHRLMAHARNLDAILNGRSESAGSDGPEQPVETG